MTVSESTCIQPMFHFTKTGDERSLVKLVNLERLTSDDVNYQDKNGRTCLSYAAAGGYTQIIDVLLLLPECHADPNIADKEGNTPLIYAAAMGNALVTMKLIHFGGVNINQQNHFGFTAVMKASIQGHTTIVDFLIKAGAKLDVTDHSRHLNALQWAKLCGSHDCVKALRKALPKHKHLNRQTSKAKRENNSPTGYKSFVGRLRQIISTGKEDHRDSIGIRSIVFCGSTSAITALIANSTLASVPPELVSSQTLKPARRTSEPARRASLPRIEITSDTGEKYDEKGFNRLAKRRQSAPTLVFNRQQRSELQNDILDLI